jgi:hypothetical protein
MLRRFRNWNAIERRLVLEALVAVPVARVVLTVVPLRVIVSGMQRTRRNRSDVPLERIAWATNAIDRRVPRSNCLTRAVAASLLLRRHGHPATLRLGVSQTDGRVAAHAWLESDGRPVVGDAGTFTALG